MKKNLGRSAAISNIGYPLGLVVFYLLISLFVPRLLTLASIFNILTQASVTVIAAVAVTMVIISGGIDLSCGGMFSLAGVINAILVVNLNVNPLVSIVITLLTGALLGGVSGVTVARIKIPSFIATLAVGNLAAGLALVFAKGGSMAGLPDGFKWLGRGEILEIPVAVYIMALFVVVGSLVLNKSAFGNRLFGIGNNVKVVKNEGVNIERIVILVYAISGFCSAFAGILLSSWLGAAHPTQGAQYQLDIIAACILGGTSMMGGEGKILNSALGAVIISALRTTLNLMRVNSYIQNLFVGSILIVIVALTTYLQKKSNKQSALF